MKNEPIVQCLLCGGSAELKHEKYQGYQKPNTFCIYNCSECNTSFSLPQTDSKDIYELIYKYGPKVRWYDIYWRHSEMVKKSKDPLQYLAESEASYWGVQRSLKKILKNGEKFPKILEIGCGLGYLTYALNKSGYDTIGLDISKEAVTNATKNYGNLFICADLFEYSNLHTNEYDIVIFTEVIEHLNDINGFMMSLIKLLKSKGNLILTTPNKSFYPADVLWATDLPPVHYWWLSEDSIFYIANKLNLTSSFVDFKRFYNRHPMGFDIRKIEIPITPPVFAKDGTLIGKSTLVFKSESYFKKHLKEFILPIYAKIRVLLLRRNPNYVIPGKRGPTICAIIENKEMK